MVNEMVNFLGQEIIPENDEQRLQALYRYQILDTAPEKFFTDLVNIIAEVFNVPIALISLVDREHVFFKGNKGMPGVKKVERGKSFCSLAVLSPEPTIIENAAKDPCFLANPLVHGDFGLRFYAGAPLTTPDGFNIGTVCIIDKNERNLSEKERERLVRFSNIIMHDIELRVASLHQQDAEQEVLKKNQELQDLSQELQFVTDTIPQLAWTADAGGNSVFLNKNWSLYTGLSEGDLLGDGWLEVLHPDDLSRTESVWRNAVKSGSKYEVEYRLRRNDGIYRWFLARSTPMKDSNGTILKWYGTTTDIHEHKQVEEVLEKWVKERTADLEKQKAFNESILDSSLNGILALDAIRDEHEEIIDFKIVKINKQFTTLIGLDESIVGGSYLHYFPQGLDNEMFELFKNVLISNEPVRKEMYSNIQNLNSWFDVSVAKRDANGIVVTFANISQQREAAIRIEQQKNLLDSILKHSPAGITVYKAIRDDEGKLVDLKCIISNEAAETFTGITNANRFSKSVLELSPNLKDSPLFQMAVLAIEKGKDFRTEYYHEQIGKWLELSVVKMYEDHLINVFIDVTNLKKAQLEIEQSAERLKAVFNYAQSGMFTFKPERNEEGDITDFRFVITNPTFAAYVGQTPEKLNGELGSTWFPGYLTNGVFDMYKKTFITGETQRLEVHYNVDKLDLYLDLMSTKMDDEVLVTFTDFSELKKTQFQLEKYIEDLKHSNTNLEDFAYAASHDLKEPVRKVHVFADRLINSLKDRLTETEIHYFDRMTVAAKRMNSLIEDLLSYTEVSRGIGFKDEVDLNEVIEQVLNDLDLEIEEKNAKVAVSELCKVKGHKRQLQQAFQNLITNAIKYNKPGEHPQVIINSKILSSKELSVLLTPDQVQQKYCLIEVQDNGIGFDQKDADRIFNVFQRLHGNAEYRGTGLGLSIVRKVIENHKGHVFAEGEPDAGATFKVLLPV